VLLEIYAAREGRLKERPGSSAPPERRDLRAVTKLYQENVA
jgi:hypothetical protein